MPSDAVQEDEMYGFDPDALSLAQWQQKANQLASLLRDVTGDMSLCGLFQLTPGGVMGVMANHAKKEQDPSYRQLKAFLMGIKGIDRASLLTGHCPNAAYDELNHLCQLAKK